MPITFHVPNSDPWVGFTGDDFTGTNGDPLNTVVWEDQGSTDEWLIQSNKANVVQPAAAEALSYSLFSVSGNFDVQIDFDTSVEVADYVLRIVMWEAGWNYIEYTGIQIINTNKNFHYIFKTAGVSDSQVTVARTNTFGKLKLARSGSTVTISRQDGAAGWTELGNKVQNTTDRFIFLQGKTFGAGSLTANFDNFLINSGTIVGP